MGIFDRVVTGGACQMMGPGAVTMASGSLQLLAQIGQHLVVARGFTRRVISGDCGAYGGDGCSEVGALQPSCHRRPKDQPCHLRI